MTKDHKFNNILSKYLCTIYIKYYFYIKNRNILYMLVYNRKLISIIDNVIVLLLSPNSRSPIDIHENLPKTDDF